MGEDYPSISHGNLGITGHRPHKLGGYDNFTNLCEPIKWRLDTFFKEKNPYSIVSGMALGVDQWAVEVALNIGIKVIAMIPCVGQESRWPISAQNYYARLLERIDMAHGQITYVSLGPYTIDCMHRRNMEIVNSSSEMLAVWDGTRGGTRDCVRYAQSTGLAVTVLNPRTLEFSNLEMR